MSERYKGTMVSDESIKKNPGLNRGVTKYLTKAGRFLIDTFGQDPKQKNNPPTGKPVIRKKKKGGKVMFSRGGGVATQGTKFSRNG